MKRARLPLFLSMILGLATLPTTALAETEEDEVALEDEGEDVGDDDSEAMEESGDTDPSAVVVYRTQLAPYGSWVDTPGYGLVWVPNSGAVGPDFTPYVSRGRWELTDDGDWLWVSGYDWGYIPFHYGRWVWVGGLGWSWIPGRVYSPAWVVWRVGAGGYIGWAPYPATYIWIDGRPYHRHHHHHHVSYVFVNTDRAFDPHVHQHVVHDRDEVKKAAASTHQHAAPAPSAGAKSAPMKKLKSPSLEDAHIQPSAAPKKRSKPDPRSLALSSDKSLAPPTKGGETSQRPAAAKTKAEPVSYLTPTLKAKRDSMPTRKSPTSPSLQGANLSATSASPSDDKSSSPSSSSPTRRKSRAKTWSTSPGSESASSSRPSDSVESSSKSKPKAERAARPSSKSGSSSSKLSSPTRKATPSSGGSKPSSSGSRRSSPRR